MVYVNPLWRCACVNGAPLLAIHYKTITTILYCLLSLHLQQVSVIFKNLFSRRPLSIDAYFSFEVLACEVDLAKPLLCALIYRTPKSNTDFLTDFSDILSNLATKADDILLLDNFNVHVCCTQKPFVKEFNQLLDSFNFTQFISGPTHMQGHTLDLVMTSGLPIANTDIRAAGLF